SDIWFALILQHALRIGYANCDGRAGAPLQHLCKVCSLLFSELIVLAEPFQNMRHERLGTEYRNL
ncbi:MAG: hypothetical protein DMF20_11535, partial [Verrucomicrobia bacterium]